MFVFSLLACVFSIKLQPDEEPFFFESFQDDSWRERWQFSGLSNYSGRWDHRETKAPQTMKNEKMIFASEENKYYALSTKFGQQFDPKDKTIVVQYEVRSEDKWDCGGAYMKLFSSENFESPETVSNETHYVIMFGPDKCGDENKVHFIFRHLEPNGEYQEKHLKEPPSMKNDRLNHLYTLIVRPDNSFEILIDGASEKKGNLLEDFEPSVNPPKTIDDPTDMKPLDWDDQEFIDDPDSEKPDDWDESEPEYIPDPSKLDPPEGWLTDEPRFIPDPNAEPPEDWDADMYGEWEPPTIVNPKCESAPGCGEYEPPLIENENYRGKWEPQQIENPNYKGPWKARQIPNPDYYEDPDPHNFHPITGIGFELWLVDKDIGFSNVYIGTDEGAVRRWNDDSFIPRLSSQTASMKEIEKNEEKAAEENFDSSSPVEPAVSVGNFLGRMSSAWDTLVNENQYAAILIVFLVLLVPILFLVLGILYCNEQKRKRRLLRKEMLRKKRALRRALKKKREEEEKKKEEERKRKEEEDKEKEEEKKDTDDHSD